MSEVTAFLPYLVIILGPGGAAYAAVKAGLNGTKEDIKEIKDDISGLKADVGELKEEAAFQRGQRARGANKG